MECLRVIRAIHGLNSRFYLNFEIQIILTQRVGVVCDKESARQKLHFLRKLQWINITFNLAKSLL